MTARPDGNRVLAFGALDGFEHAAAVLARHELRIEAVGAGPWRDERAVALLVDPAGPLDDAAVAGLPALRVVATASTGRDHVRIPAAEGRGVEVRSVPDYCSQEVADSAIALLLGLLRGSFLLDREVREGGWPAVPGLPLRRARDTRLGLVGLGTIGGAVAEKAIGLGMRVRACDPLATEQRAARLGVELCELDALLAGSDALSLHVPLLPDTRALIGARELERLPRGGVLVNTARGELVDVGAVMAALDSGQLAAAGLDVLPEEPPTRAPRHPRLVVTPHAAWFSEAALRTAYASAAEAIAATLAGTPA